LRHRGRKSLAERESQMPPAILRRHLAAVPSSSAIDRHPPPAHLGPIEQSIWAHALEDFDVATELSLDVLTTALEDHQLARECREIIDREGLQVAGRGGVLRAHPLLATERDARAAWRAAIKQLGLDL
jgi:P27 family predicted phage terminase small subunit